VPLDLVLARREELEGVGAHRGRVNAVCTAIAASHADASAFFTPAGRQRINERSGITNHSHRSPA
jgi:hypothetical protein